MLLLLLLSSLLSLDSLLLHHLHLLLLKVGSELDWLTSCLRGLLSRLLLLELRQLWVHLHARLIHVHHAARLRLLHQCLLP